MKAKTAKRAMAMTTRVFSNNKGDGNGDNGGGHATAMRAMVGTTTVVGNNEGDGGGNEGGRQQRG